MLISVKIRLKFFFGIWVIIFAQFLQYILCTVVKLTILSRLERVCNDVLSILDNDSEKQEDFFHDCKTDF